MFRENKVVDPAETALISQGEWVAFNASNQAVKVVGAAPAAPAVGALVNWTRFKKGDASDGQADAAGLGEITVIRGAYEADTKKFDPVPPYTVGDLLVVVDDGAGNGWLFPITPAAATAVQIASAVGKVTAPPVAGVLAYASMGAAS
jgi:hypothetical protein